MKKFNNLVEETLLELTGKVDWKKIEKQIKNKEDFYDLSCKMSAGETGVGYTVNFGNVFYNDNGMKFKAFGATEDDYKLAEILKKIFKIKESDVNVIEPDELDKKWSKIWK